LFMFKNPRIGLRARDRSFVRAYGGSSFAERYAANMR
jgi:hypothetical protein